MHRQGARLHFPLRVEVAVKAPAGKLAAHHLDAADFNHAVTEAELQARGFRVQHDLSHEHYPR